VFRQRVFERQIMVALDYSVSVTAVVHNNIKYELVVYVIEFHCVAPVCMMIVILFKFAVCGVFFPKWDSYKPRPKKTPHSGCNRFSPLRELINLAFTAFRRFDYSYKREVLLLHLVEATFEGLAVREELALLAAVRRAIVDEVSTLAVSCLHIGQEVDNLYLAIQNVSD